MDKAVILARGLGTRMRKQDGAAGLTGEQAAIAQTGVKAMIPIDRPFLDYALSGLADAGYKRICLVIGPEHGVVRDHCNSLSLSRISLDFAIQEEPLGTADAVAAVEGFAAGEPFAVINSDNYYPKESLAALRKLSGPGLAVFTREGMLASGNVEPERLMKFAVVQTDGEGNMLRIIEKPQPEVVESLPAPVCVSMNCWRFHKSIFPAIQAIEPSLRGELEITDAVQYCIDHLSERFRALPFDLPVLDMSSRADIGAVSEQLKRMEVRL